MFLNQIPDNCKLTSGNSMNHHQLKSDVSFHFSSEKTLSLVKIVETGKKIRAAGSCCMDQSSYFKCLFRPNNLDFFGRVLSGYQGVIAKIKQFCDRFEILILTQLILKRRHCLRQVLKKKLWFTLSITASRRVFLFSSSIQYDDSKKIIANPVLPVISDSLHFVK